MSGLDNETAVKHLTAVKGIGRWTTEMFLIFSLSRPDVFPFGDGGLKNAIGNLYGGFLTGQLIKEISEQWAPYRSYACLYLWKSLDNEPTRRE